MCAPGAGLWFVVPADIVDQVVDEALFLFVHAAQADFFFAFQAEDVIGSCVEQLCHLKSFSRNKLIEQLEYEGFTREQAAYGVNKAY